ncbi:hypothetical protein HPB49_001746 [Dermacentor silvarum]|uniref:Uncharacterized protein n=1 Tax=Dermacentor silvarum TaxID=543639 RepID=A0ACB8DSJ9_DERSI|nr:hypothetical protein HPB49_001746 [Dermacentor silvarum]
MRYLSLTFLGYWLSLLSSVGVVSSSARGEGDKLEPPTVLIAVILRNKAHVLPYFFGYLEQQSYPKSRISLWIYTDHNVDQTPEMVDTWAEAVSSEYHNVNVTSEDGDAFFPDEEGSQKWTAQRYWHVIRLREEAIQVARTLWADFILFLDGDALLSNPKTIQDLVEENRTIIAPMLDSRSAYSNFWCGMNEKGYYERTDEYMPILEKEKVGVFPVVMVHSATLINLNHADSRKLTYHPEKLEGYTGPIDDVITFAHSAKFAVDGEPLLISPALQSFMVPLRKDTLGFDQVYLINLERRPERRKRMEYCFEELGVAFKFIAAVDGNSWRSRAPWVRACVKSSAVRDDKLVRNSTRTPAHVSFPSGLRQAQVLHREDRIEFFASVLTLYNFSFLGKRVATRVVSKGGLSANACGLSLSI